MSLDALLAAKPTADAFPVEALRAQFPSVVNAEPFVFFDNGGGAQLPKNVIDEVTRHLMTRNVQRGGRYAKSVEVDQVLSDARAKVAALVNARDPQEVCFGLNGTSFIRLISLAVGQTLKPERDEIIVTDLDHDANIATWMALQPMGARITVWKMRDDGRLYVDDLRPLLSERTRLVACNTASHAIGSLTPVAEVAKAAHAVGAEVFLDSVHFTPHGPIDVQSWDCDYLVCSGYKAFSPHMGFMWGRFDKLVELPTFREDFIPDAPPFKVEAGTQIYENIAGMGAVIDYLEGLADHVSASPQSSRRAKLVAAMSAIQAYERTLSERMLTALNAAGATVYGVSDPAKVEQRVPTLCFNLRDLEPAEVVVRAAEADIGIRDGHMYAPRLMARLGLSMNRGAVRASLLHYNTYAEVDRFAEFLQRLG